MNFCRKSKKQTRTNQERYHRSKELVKKIFNADPYLNQKGISQKLNEGIRVSKSKDSERL